jgi:hypothetical protein
MACCFAKIAFPDREHGARFCAQDKLELKGCRVKMLLGENRTAIKMAVAVLAFCAFTQGAAAKGPECRIIKDTGARLACYDTASPPEMKKPAPVANDASPTAYQDPFAAEEARTAAKLKTICRGC